ncbi:PREDICTED: uncharacterized protein LOC109220564 [Nicotiana attenuata]|uniref:uncharacterized protein LOC109220564 n=1 Tax=Nicotiana attenuata TaxID=49451 RepID=UPI00090498BB|nr:PREDICTED: uncharacterized protein LOC109220564 [Nicotiana attenuata]
MAEENPFAENQIVVESSHPLYLSPSDNPGTDLVFTLFDGTGYGQSDVAQLFGLQKKLLETIQGCNDIATYFNNIKAIWDELNALDAKIACTCVECICEAKPKNKAIEERQKLVQFLMGLNETYTACRGNIMIMTPTPNIDKKFGQYSGQSRMNFNLNTGGGNRNNAAKGSDRRNMICSYCQRSGHTIERCFKIHGYPNSFKTNMQGNMQGNRTRNFQNPNMIQGNAVSIEEEFGNVQQYNQGIQQHNSSSIMGINQEQYSQLMEILQQVKIGQQAASNSEVNVTANCAASFATVTSFIFVLLLRIIRKLANAPSNHVMLVADAPHHEEGVAMVEDENFPTVDEKIPRPKKLDQTSKACLRMNLNLSSL